MSFERKFRKLLSEDIDLDLERQAMEDSLDDDVSADEFDLDMEADPMSSGNEVADAFSRQTQEIVSTLTEWEGQIDQFLEFLNSDSPNSVQSKLAAAVPDTIMDRMKGSTQTKIAKVASDLASLQQTILGFKSQATNSKFLGV